MHDENTRAASIKRFLSKPPKSFHKLVLTGRASGTDTEVVLGEWPGDENVTPSLCDTEIIPALDDHAGEMNASIVAVLSWYSASGVKMGAEKVINRSNPNASASGSLASTAEQLSGDYTSQASQAQKHLEVMTKMYLGNMNEMFKLQRQSQEHTMELCDRLAQRVVDSERAAERAKQERDEAVEVVQAVQQSEGTDSEVNASQAQMMQQLAPFIPQLMAMFVKALGPGAAPTPAPSDEG